jgi:hypothetical protein
MATSSSKRWWWRNQGVKRKTQSDKLVSDIPQTQLMAYLYALLSREVGLFQVPMN